MNKKILGVIIIIAGIILLLGFLYLMFFSGFFQQEAALPDVNVNINQPVENAKEIVNLDLVKLNLPATLLSYILKAIFKKAKIVLISNELFLYEHIHNFFKYITQDSFNVDLTLISKAEYDANKKTYKKCMVFEGNKILNNYKKIIDPKKLKVETQLIKNFLSEPDLAYSYIALRNEIHKAYQLSKDITDIFNETIKKNESPNILKINNQVEQIYNIKINTVYLNSLVTICKDYFGAAIPSITNGFLEL